MQYDIMPFMDAIGIDSIVFYNSSSMTSEVYKHASPQIKQNVTKATEKRQELTKVES